MIYDGITSEDGHESVPGNHNVQNLYTIYRITFIPLYVLTVVWKSADLLSVFSCVFRRQPDGFDFK